jgi:hypothetical protein
VDLGQPEHMTLRCTQHTPLTHPTAASVRTAISCSRFVVVKVVGYTPAAQTQLTKQDAEVLDTQRTVVFELRMRLLH